MDDDKREKLREYLRNNRPRNNINLGNNSNNKENSTENLEKDLNLDKNLNSDNSQISNNKTNFNKRDYDKEPLILQDYTNFMQLDLLINGVLFFIVAFELMMFVFEMNFIFLSFNTLKVSYTST